MPDIKHYAKRIREGALKDVWRETVWIYRYARNYWKQMIFYTVLGLAGTAVSLISSLISRDMVDIITGKQAGLLLQTFCLYIGFSVGNVFVAQLSGYFSNKISLGVENVGAGCGDGGGNPPADGQFLIIFFALADYRSQRA